MQTLPDMWMRGKRVDEEVMGKNAEGLIVKRMEIAVVNRKKHSVSKNKRRRAQGGGEICHAV